MVREKVEAVQRLVGEGYTVRAACTALAVPRSSYYAAQRPQPEIAEAAAEPSEGPDGELLEKIQALKTEHPFWGYRRVWAWLRHREKILVNQKKVRRIMKAHSLMATQTAHKAKRTPPKSKPQASRPRQLWGIDMTKFMIAALGWVYLVIVIDWYTKKIVGWDVALRSKAGDWQRVVEQAVMKEFPHGVRGAGLQMVSDNGSQPTATSFMKAMSDLDIQQIFTTYNNPKGNADTERVIRTLKEEIIWPEDFGSLEEAIEKLRHGIEVNYNQLYVHSTLGYQSPAEFEAEYYESLKKVS